MAVDKAVAPKERINITYIPETGDAQEEVELPLKLMIVGDFMGRPDDRLVEDRDPINVDKDNFDDVMREQKLAVDTGVANRLSDGGDEIGLSLKFDTLKDFEPEQLVRQVPELSALMELREALVALKGPLGNVPAFRKKIQAVLQDDEARKRLLEELEIGDSDEAGKN